MKHKVAFIALFTLVALLGSALSAQAGGRRSSFGFGTGNRGYFAPYSYASPGYYPFGTYRYYSPFGTYRSYYPFGTYQQYYPFGSYSVPSYRLYPGPPAGGYILVPSPAPGYRNSIPRRGNGRHYGNYAPRKYYRRDY
jgi:hypothetical protein